MAKLAPPSTTFIVLEIKPSLADSDNLLELSIILSLTALLKNFSAAPPPSTISQTFAIFPTLPIFPNVPNATKGNVDLIAFQVKIDASFGGFIFETLITVDFNNSYVSEVLYYFYIHQSHIDNISWLIHKNH